MKKFFRIRQWMSRCFQLWKAILNILTCILLLIFPMYSAFAAYPGELPASTSPQTAWIFNRANACLNDDKITHVAANGECLALQTYFGKTLPQPHPILLVFIHGDGIPGGGPSDYLKYEATKFMASDVVPVVLIRPGYYDSYGNYSTGESYAFNNHGYPTDSYPPHTVATLADAVKNLKNFYAARCTILVGHSGGGMMSAVILGKYPGLANGAVLASMVGNPQQWSEKHGYGSYPNSLAADDFVSHIPKQDFAYIISGDQDDNTYPEMAKSYYNLLVKNGVQAHWSSVKGGTHNSVVSSDAQAFEDAIAAAISEC